MPHEFFYEARREARELARTDAELSTAALSGDGDIPFDDPTKERARRIGLRTRSARATWTHRLVAARLTFRGEDEIARE